MSYAFLNSAVPSANRPRPISRGVENILCVVSGLVDPHVTSRRRAWRFRSERRGLAWFHRHRCSERITCSGRNRVLSLERDRHSHACTRFRCEVDLDINSCGLFSLRYLPGTRRYPVCSARPSRHAALSSVGPLTETAEAPVEMFWSQILNTLLADPSYRQQPFLDFAFQRLIFNGDAPHASQVELSIFR